MQESINKSLLQKCDYIATMAEIGIPNSATTLASRYPLRRHSPRSQKGSNLRNLGRFFAILCVASLPFEMVISVIRHQLVLRVGPIGYLFHPATGFFLSVLVGGLPSRVRNNFWFVAWLAVYAFGLIISGIVTSSAWFYILSTTLLGPAFMSLVLVTFVDDEFRCEATTAFFFGMVLWSVAFLSLYLFTVASTFRLDPDWRQLPLDKLLMAVRAPGDDYDFFMFKISGNFNKQSNLLVITILLASYLLMIGRLSLKVWSVFLLPILFALFLMFSRGAIGVLLLSGIAFAIVSFITTDRRYFLITGSVVALFLASISTPLFRSYWIDTSSLEQREIIAKQAVTGSSDTFLKSGEVAAVPNGRNAVVVDSNEEVPAIDIDRRKALGPAPEDAACVAKSPIKTLFFDIFGYGLGNFGPTICRSAEAESHNAFIDAWMQGGILGFVGYIGLFVAGVFAGVRNIFRSRFKGIEAIFGTAVICATGALALREFAFVYLWVQSSGGFLTAIGLSMAAAPAIYRTRVSASSRQLRSSTVRLRQRPPGADQQVLG